MSEMNLTFGTNCTGLDIRSVLNRSSDVPCTGNYFVFIITLDSAFTYSFLHIKCISKVNFRQYRVRCYKMSVLAGKETYIIFISTRSKIRQLKLYGSPCFRPLANDSKISFA